MENMTFSSLSRFPRSRGFTLVELSIVLVIIGLLIGGILAAQSMISSARLNSQVAQIGQFDAAITSFKSKFNYLPSDSRAFGGDGDGLIERYPDANDSINVYSGEISNFWPTLFPEKYTTPAGVQTVIPGVNAPLAKIGIGNAHIFISAIGQGSVTCSAADVRNYYAIFSPNNYRINSPTNVTFQILAGQEGLKPTELLALDKKMDDGTANAGTILSGTIFNNWGGIHDSPNANCSSGATYTLTNTGYECMALIRIGGSTGDPQ